MSRGRWSDLDSAATETQQRQTPNRLGGDREVHLRFPYPPLAKKDRHLDDAEPAADRTVGQLDLEGVAAGGDLVEVDGLQHLAAEALEATGEVAHLDPQHQPRVGTAAAADRAPKWSPVADPPARDVAGAEHDVGPLGVL